MILLLLEIYFWLLLLTISMPKLVPTNWCRGSRNPYGEVRGWCHGIPIWLKELIDWLTYSGLWVFRGLFCWSAWVVGMVCGCHLWELWVLLGPGWPFPGCGWVDGGGGSRGLCPKSRARRACSPPSEVYSAGKLQWHFTCGFDGRHSLWLSFVTAFAVLKGLMNQLM